jgi:UDP-2,3-diacylglucosamine pyrophosphatase LpxH
VNGPTLVIVSDLHLGGGPRAKAWGRGFSDAFTDDRAFSDFLRWLSERPRCRLVFLGDAFDFLRGAGDRCGLFARSDTEAVAQLDQIAAAHPPW